MKDILEQNYYELFDIPPTANREQIDLAYKLAKQTYGEQSLASYSLYSAEEREAIMKRVQVAYETLTQTESRNRYNREVLGLAPPNPAETGAPPEIPPGPEMSPAPDTIEPLMELDQLTGASLREIRERRHIPLQEIANKTRINITYLEFLEREQYRSLPPPVYLRSYLSQYARMLGLDPRRVADRILLLVEQARTPDKQ